MPDRGLRGWLERAWYSAHAPWTLRPLAGLYRLVVAVRRACYAAGLFRSGHPGVPVVVIGNISVGGAGKTPLTLWLARRLGAQGLSVGIATRGYGGATRLARVVAPDADPLEFGDEPVLLARRSGGLVCVARRRLDAARKLAASGCQLILCDDGLQHLALRRDFEIAVVDATRGVGNGWMLPAGPLREPVRRLQEVGLVVLNGSESPDLGVPAARIVHMGLQPGAARSLTSDAQARLGEFRGRPVHAFAAIGNPGRFFAMLRANGIQVTEHAFADHHPFESRDFATGDDNPILMTEKDAVKCARFADLRMWYVPVTALLPEEDAERLLGAVRIHLAAASLPGGDQVSA